MGAAGKVVGGVTSGIGSGLSNSLQNGGYLNNVLTKSPAMREAEARSKYQQTNQMIHNSNQQDFEQPEQQPQQNFIDLIKKYTQGR